MMRAVTKPRRPQLYFYCNAIPEEVRVARGIVTDSPAATRKIIAMSKALQSAGVEVVVVSMGRSANSGGAYHRGGRFRVEGIPFIIGPVWAVPVVSQLLSAIWLALTAARLCSWGSGRQLRKHLFYNQMSLYVPALLVLFLLRQETAVDIEDGPLSRSKAAYSRFGANAAPVFECCITGGAILAASRLAAGTSLRPVTTCYGAVTALPDFDGARFSSETIRVVFAGYISDETGFQQFEEAVKLMRRLGDRDFRALEFDVAGFGPGLARLQALADGQNPMLRVHGRLDAGQYRSMLQNAHIGLSLKPVGGEISETTYPSKTIEIAEHGLALITTDVSDVREVFGDAAMYLPSNDGETLVAALLSAIGNRARLAEIARRGRGVVTTKLTSRAVGERLARFLFGETR